MACDDEKSDAGHFGGRGLDCHLFEGGGADKCAIGRARQRILQYKRVSFHCECQKTLRSAQSVRAISSLVNYFWRMEMSWFSQAVDAVANTVTNVVNNPVPVVVGTVAIGPAGTVLGAAVANDEAEAKAKQEQAIEEYRRRINQAITDLQNAAPDYVQLEIKWIEVTTEALVAAYKDRYKDACPKPEVLGPMIVIDVNDRRQSLSKEDFKKQLDDIHAGAVEAGTKQLQHERDEPEKQAQPSSSDVLNKFFSELFNSLGHWLEKRFDSNFEGSKNESGFGAKVLRGGLGISWEDIKARGLLGGDNSYFRKIIPTWSDNGGVFGGENSFFRKPFG